MSNEQTPKYSKLVETRSEHRMNLLPNGTVLITGGQSKEGQVLASAEIFDPNNGSTVSIPGFVARQGHSSIALPDGRVVLVGGTGSDDKPLGQIEIYNPKENKFFPLMHLIVPRSKAAAVRVSDEKIFVTGGVDSEANILDSIEILNLQSLEIIPHKKKMRYPRANHCAVLSDGHLLLSGGIGNDKSPKTAEIFDLELGVVLPLIELKKKRILHTSTPIPKKGIFLYSNSVGELISLTKGISSKHYSSPVPEIRDNHSATILNDGTVLIAGGVIPAWAQGLLGDPLIYQLDAGKVISLNQHNGLLDRANHAAVNLANGDAPFTGGQTLEAASTDDIILFSYTEKSFKRFAR